MLRMFSKESAKSSATVSRPSAVSVSATTLARRAAFGAVRKVSAIIKSAAATRLPQAPREKVRNSAANGTLISRSPRISPSRPVRM
ncbi:MAG: hypothetical protein C0420_12285 [Methylobacterium sp.]|nr:hypothetical protein [Methylobacterium sp.]